MQKVSAYVAEQPADSPPSRNAVKQNVGGRAPFVRQAIDALLGEGHLKETEGAGGARLLTFVKPYRADDDEAR